jgi:DNA invertase Pin-like site-specific DNA recombinase
MKIGYARVSTEDQNLNLQIDALRDTGCADSYIYKEEISGVAKERPELKRLLEQIREGDIVVVWKLDRLGRSLTDLVHLVNEIQNKGAGLLSLHDNIDTTTPQGKLTFHIFAAVAEFEREIIRERTNAGLAAARARGQAERINQRISDKSSCGFRSLPSKTISFRYLQHAGYFKKDFL